MGDHIIDTNVLLVASARHPGSTFKDSQVPAEQQQMVLDWVMEFRKDGQRKMVLDRLWRIWTEYHHKMTGQDLGLLVVTEKLQSDLVRFVDVAYDEHGHGCLPPDLEEAVHDLSDRKFVAAALIDFGGRRPKHNYQRCRYGLVQLGKGPKACRGRCDAPHRRVV